MLLSHGIYSSPHLMDYQSTVIKCAREGKLQKANLWTEIPSTNPPVLNSSPVLQRKLDDYSLVVFSIQSMVVAVNYRTAHSSMYVEVVTTVRNLACLSGKGLGGPW